MTLKTGCHVTGDSDSRGSLEPSFTSVMHRPTSVFWARCQIRTGYLRNVKCGALPSELTAHFHGGDSGDLEGSRRAGTNSVPTGRGRYSRHSVLARFDGFNPSKRRTRRPARSALGFPDRSSEVREFRRVGVSARIRAEFGGVLLRMLLGPLAEAA